MSIGILTSGGDAPGMNAAIRAAVRYAVHQDRLVYGIHNGYRGLCEGKENIKPMAAADVAQIINRGGTILRSSRYPDFKDNPDTRERALEILNGFGISSLVVIGGDGSFKGAQALFQTNVDKKIIEKLFIVCIPASIDNDIPYTKFSIGTDTALNTAVDCIDKLRDTAYSHKRIFVIQVMGHECDYLPYMTAVSTGASYVLPPDHEFQIIKGQQPEPSKKTNYNHKIDISKLTGKIDVGFRTGKDFFMVIVAEGLSESLKKINIEGSECTPADIVAREINLYLSEKDVKDVSVRPVVLGHVQRGGKPSHFDRFLATKLGVKAVEEIIQNKNEHPAPIMVGLQNDSNDLLTCEVKSIPLRDVLVADIPKCNHKFEELLKYVTR